MALKVVFAGTPAFAAEHLQALLDSPHRVVAVYSQPDRPAGRGRQLSASPVTALARDAGLPVHQPVSLKTPEARADLAALDADVLVVVAYGLLLPPAVLAIPRLGCINVHASLLPRWRGAAPIHRALLAGDERSGVTVMQMDAGLDTGAMLLTAECALDARETSASLHDKLIGLGRSALVEALDGLEAGTLSPQPQDERQATYAAKLAKAEGELDWHQPATDLDRQVRGLTPWPGAYTHWRGQTLRIHQADARPTPARVEPGRIQHLTSDAIEVACGEGVLALERIQLPGKKAMSVAEVLNARRDDFVNDDCFGAGA